MKKLSSKETYTTPQCEAVEWKLNHSILTESNKNATAEGIVWG